MPTVITGTSTTDPTTAPTVSAPAAGDSVSSGPIDAAFQTVANGLGWLRANCALRNMAGAILSNLGNGAAAGDAVNVGQLAPSSWSAASSYGTNWSASLGGLQGWKDLAGKVHLKGGVLAGASAGNTCATLPAGLRPSTARYIMAPHGGNPILWKVDTDGTISITNGLGGGAPVTPGSGLSSGFDGVSFFA